MITSQATECKNSGNEIVLDLLVSISDWNNTFAPLFQNKTAVDANRLYNKENGGFCIRLYDKNGIHKASLLPCGVHENGDVACWDLANPDGEVFCCNIENEVVDAFAMIFGFEQLR